MIPSEMHASLKKVFLLRFDEEPPYDEILANLTACFEKLVIDSSPICPPSMKQNEMPNIARIIPAGK